MIHKLLMFAILLAYPWMISMAQDHEDHDSHSAARTSSEDAQQLDNVDGEHHGERHSAGKSDGHADHEGESEQFAIELSPEAAALIDLATSIVAHGRISKTIELPGEVGFNEDKLAHIAPRFAGIAQQAIFRVGEYVEAGEVMAVVESNESLNSYPVPASISGWVIERHITPGEYVSQENSIYVIADLSSVWVNLAVYPKDFDRVTTGMSAHIKAVGSSKATTGTIDYITPIIDYRTRSATARVILPNPANAWRPGTFVQATVSSEDEHESLVVERDAVQYLNEKSIVFVVEHPSRFRPVDVVIGESDENHIRILSGLEKGTPYVSDGAFELKAKIVTSNLDAHAGHGH